MILKYGTYSHAQNEAAIQISRTAKIDQRARRQSIVEQWRIDGQLHGDTQAELTTAINALETAYATDNKDLTLYLDNGTTATSHQLLTAEALGGVRVVNPPSYPQGRGAEYATFRAYAITVEAEFLQAIDDDLVEWRETVTLTGGGPRFLYLQPLTGLPQKQQVAQSTPYRATQEGRAVGLTAYPFVPSPIWGGAEHVDQRQIRKEGPRRSGPTGSAVFTEWPISWQYSFESDAPLVGDPGQL